MLAGGKLRGAEREAGGCWERYWEDDGGEAGEMPVGKVRGAGGMLGGVLVGRLGRCWGGCWGDARKVLGASGKEGGRMLGQILVGHWVGAGEGATGGCWGVPHSQGLVGLDVGAQAEAQGPAPLLHALCVVLQRRPVQGQRRGGQLLQGGS